MRVEKLQRKLVALFLSFMTINSIQGAYSFTLPIFATKSRSGRHCDVLVKTPPTSALRIQTASNQLLRIWDPRTTSRDKVRLREYIWWLDPNSLFVQSLGITALWVILPYITRITQAERAWEERLEEARRLKEEETGVKISDLEFYRESAASYPSFYGPKGLLKQREERKKAEQQKKEGTFKENDYEDNKEREIEEFEAQYGVDYDPYYDEPYTEEELPSDLRFYTNPGYGDRIYEDGQIFYKEYVQNEETGERGEIFYRRGAKPRLRKFLSWN